MFIKRRSKVQEKNMSCEHASNFNQWKTFSENYKPMRVWLWLVYKITENYCRSWRFSEFIQTQERYPNLKATCHMKLKCFLWTKLLENLLLAQYLMSVAAPLTACNFVFCIWMFHLSQSKTSKNLTKIATSINVSRD